MATALLIEIVFQGLGVSFRAQIFSEAQYLYVLSAAMLLYVAGIAIAKRALSNRQY